MIQQFSRIQIACESVSQTIVEFSVLLGVAPCWRGCIQESSQGVGEGNSAVPAAWFAIEKCLLELVPAEHLQRRAGIAGFTLLAEGEGELPARLSGEIAGDMSERLYMCDDDFTFDQQLPSGAALAAHFERGQWRETIYRLEAKAANGLCLAVSSRQLLPLPVGGVETRRVDHIVLRTNSAEQCIELFSQALGMRLALDQMKPEWGGRMLFFRTGKMTLEIIAPEAGLKAGDYFWGLALQVAQLDAEHTRLESAGVTVSDLRSGRKPGTRVVTVKSHSGGIPTLLVGQ